MHKTFFQEHPSSDSFYDSDGDGGSDLTTVERPGKTQQEEEIEERQRHDSAEVDGTRTIFIDIIRTTFNIY